MAKKNFILLEKKFSGRPPLPLIYRVSFRNNFNHRTKR